MRKALIAGLVGLVLGGTAQAGELKIAPKVEKYTEKYYDGGEVAKIDGWLKGVEISNESDSFLGLPIASGLKVELVNYSALTDGASGRGLFSHPEDPQGDSCFSKG